VHTFVQAVLAKDGKRRVTMKKLIISCLVSVMVLLGFSMAAAQSGVPEKMLIRGTLPEKIDGNILPRDAQVTLTLGIYDTVGSLLW
jgi:hypothetical protein